MEMNADQRLYVFEHLGVALGQRPKECLGDAARRIVRRRGPQIMAAQIVLSSDATGDAAWSRLRIALKAAERCRWPTPPDLRRVTDEGKD